MTASAACHLLAAGLLVVRPRAWRAGAAVLAADHLALSAAGGFPHRPWLGPVMTSFEPVPLRLDPAVATAGPGRRVARVDEPPDIALTFDDGPDPDVTPRLAEELAARGVRASFFVIGERAERHPDLVRDLARAGHRLENHTHRHPTSFAFSFLPRLGREIGDCQDAVARLTGRQPAYFRAPAGMRNPLLEAALARRGLTLVSWTRRGFDTVDGDPGRVYRRLEPGIRRGAILLLHDGQAARAPSGRAVVLEVLPRLLDRIAAAGLTAGPLPEPTPA